MKKIVVIMLVGVIVLLTTVSAAGQEAEVLMDGIGFHFLSMSNAVDDEGVTHRILMAGNGSFNDETVTGGGSYNEFDPTAEVPQTLMAAGTWQAESVISFSQIEHPENPWGFNLSGILELEVRLFPVEGPEEGIPAVLTIICNIPPAGILTGQPEGYFLETEDGLSFAPATFPETSFPFGITSFIVEVE